LLRAASRHTFDTLVRFELRKQVSTAVSAPRRRTRAPAETFGGETARPGAALKLDLLNGFEVFVDGRAVQVALRTQRVVAFVALNPRPVQRAWVAGSLWMDSSEVRACANLRTALWQLDLVTRPIMRVTSTHLAMADGVEVDLRDVTQRAQRLVYGTGETDEQDLPRLCQAGDLLPDWYDDWLVIERERFRQLRLGALEVLCEDLSAQGRYAQATEAGIAAVAAEPLRESAHRVLVRAHLAAGNAGEAVREYQLFRDLLRQHLGLEPSREMRELIASFVTVA
jgi:DNA-binding SARP family transcriptional activator